MKLTDKITITNEDCMELMKRTPDKYYQLAIVDIPYGLGDKLTQGGTWANKYKKGDASWDVLPTKEYFNELFRVSENQIIWGGNYAELPPTRCFLIWDKVAHMDTMADCEFAWTSFDKNAKIFKHIRNTSEKRIHITQKPIALYKWILDNYATCKYCKNEGGYYEDVAGDWGSRMYMECEECEGVPKILDTHSGSASLAIACHDYGFTLDACELDKEYYDKSIKRVQNHIKQQRLF